MERTKRLAKNFYFPVFLFHFIHFASDHRFYYYVVFVLRFHLQLRRIIHRTRSFNSLHK